MFKFMFPKLIINIERWKYNKKYECYISSMGRMKDAHRRNITPFKNEGGYFVVIANDGKFHSVHRIMMETFYPIGGMESLTVDHLDGNKANNNLSNLQWATETENQKRATAQKITTSTAKRIEEISKYPVKFFVVNDKMVSIHYLEETLRSEIKRNGMCDSDFKMKNAMDAYLRLARRHYTHKEESPVGTYYGQRLALKY